jgi:fructokinase
MIVVTGEALVDLLISQDGEVAATLGGGPFNTARTIARLGVDVAFVGSISVDRFGALLVDRLRGDGVDDSLVQRTELPTTLAAAELDTDGSATYRFYVDGTAAPALRPMQLPDDVTAVHCGTLGLVLEPMATTTEALLGALADDVLVMVDVNCRPRIIADRPAYLARIDRIASRADVVKVSSEDLDHLADGADHDDVIARLLDAGVAVVLHTDGGRAVHVRARAGGRLVIPVPAVAVVDTVGAGDAFGGGFLAWWTRRALGRADLADLLAIEAAVAASVRVAAATCERTGADPPDLTALGDDWSA